MYFELKNVSIHYDKVQALEDVSISLEQGEIVALIGANGAGKTSTLVRSRHWRNRPPAKSGLMEGGLTGSNRLLSSRWESRWFRRVAMFIYSCR
ncbi:MAG: ATP-binding cassette domain-containing protein [Verrucomicrobia bacterium]|nr:ATP-binding cassette domain-containing protein [Verrucomicrobiota bacterium]